ncbi:aminopeptidase N [Veronia nyctiphanis]|uniref:Aminopeptidase N n=1 Tax=Veronia nyctiphanis TaxID=1278244 RepID=A0A4Q0YSY0_9GAMM|nr:aminopeptidase N [Veronia nyctiphanis]RXJ74296.1 aminopeptidase N [Veronia nyctiphanis]
MTQQPQAKYRKDYTAPAFTISHIDLTFDLNDTETRVIARSKVQQNVDGAQTLTLDGEGMKLVRLEVDGKSWSNYSVEETQLVISGVPATFELEIETEINPEANTSLEGLYKSDGAYCTQCEAEGFRRITYYLDRPDVLAKFTTKVIADKGAYPYLLSNGNKIGSGDLENGKHWVQWEDPFAKPCYLFALVAGDFDCLSDVFVTKSGREVALEIFVDKGNLDRADYAMLSLKNSMKWDEDRFGLEYDLDIYMIVAVDFFNMGAMENKGLNVFNSKFVLANSDTATDADYHGIERVIGHEYFHNWSGNRVTCRDWFQLSLKEGLTVFRDQEFSSDMGSRAVNRIGNVRIMRSAQFAEDRSPMAHPIRPEKVIEMNNFYTVTVYEKGSEVIRMMHTLLGEETFQKGIELYFDRHDGTAATCDEFVQAMEEASGFNLSQFRLWYSQSGTPTLKVVSDYDAEAKTLSLTVSQKTLPTADQAKKQALLIPLDVELYAADGSVVALQRNGEALNNVLQVTAEEQVFVFDNVDDKPVVSLLREFSAPVNLEYDYSDDELAFLMVYARNEFARWDASQMLLGKHIKENVSRIQQGGEFSLPESVVDAFRGVLLNKELDRALIAEVLDLPTENEVGGWYTTIDVDAIHIVVAAIRNTFAQEMADEFVAVYQACKADKYELTHSAAADRTLKNVCLSYIALSEGGEKIVAAQYDSADNMTDTFAALAAANIAELPSRDQMMQSFSDEWHQDGLVMDKWFMLQGTSPMEGALENVKKQMSHPSFSLKNPNRLRSLIGAFAQNTVHFHAKDGLGYEFLTDILIELNEINPQVASRLIDPLLKLKYFDAERQQLIRKQLSRLVEMENLAKDLYEKVNKALEV